MKTRKKPLARPELDRDVFVILRALRHMTPAEIAKKSYLSRQTVFKIRQGPSRGGTRWPRHATMQELARIAGMRWSLVAEDESPRRSERRSNEHAAMM